MLALLFLLAAASAPSDTLSVAGLDSAAIQAALDRAQPGDTVQLAEGEYAITEAIKPKSGTRLIGAGQDKTILRFVSEKPGQAILLSGVEDVEVAQLTVDGNSNPQAAQGVYGMNSRRLNIHHVTVRDLVKNEMFGPMGIHFNGNNPTREGGVTDSVIADCTVENIGLGASFGCGIRMSWGSSRNQVLRCTIRNTGRGGIFGDNGSNDLIIRGNTVEGSGGEMLGIEVWGGCDRCVIEDNKIDHWLSIGGCDWCAARRNVISAKDGTFGFIGIEVIGSYCIVTDNLVDDGQVIGISVSNVTRKDYHYYANNTIRRCSQWGAQLQGESTGCARYYFHRCRFVDQTVGEGKVWFPGDEGNGFRINGSTKDLVLEECEFSNNARHGLQLISAGVDRLSFLRCRIEGNKGAAVVGPGDYTALEWIDCTVEGNANNTLTPAKPLTDPAPVAALEGPKTVKVGEEATFRCATPDIEAAMWDFGDGIPVVGNEVKHTYEKPGEYTVTLVVWTKAGRGARAAEAVKVSP
ncbi:MAG: PKD domain-containing protein [Armatimonadetes bacterium]|nr:PKD domain-containing protein [Armatimonadota bacterium]